MSNFGSRYGVAVPRSISKLVAVVGTIAIAYLLVHRLTQHTTLKDTSRHGNDMVGKSIQVYWPDQKAWYKARITKYNVASSHGDTLEGTHTIVYEDDSVVHSMLHKLTYHVVYGKELVSHKIMLYRPTLGYSKVATVEAFDQEAQQHKVVFDDGGELSLDLSLEEFQIMFGKELVGRVIEIRREIHDEPLYASVLHYSEMKGTFVIAFADGTVQDIDLKGVSFEIVQNLAKSLASGGCSAEDKISEVGAALVPVVEAGKDDEKIDFDRLAADAGGGGTGLTRHRAHSAAEYFEDPLRGTMLDFVENAATPGQIAILNQARQHFERGLQGNVKRDMDKQVVWFPCAHESGTCEAVEYCAKEGKLTVRYGHIDARFLNKTFSLSRFPLSCSSLNFGGDPAVGKQKFCEIHCARDPDEVKVVDKCASKTLPFIHEVATMELCTSGVAQSAPEQKLQDSIKPFCDSKKHAPGMVLQLDCRFQDAYRKFANKNFNGQPSRAGDWIDRAFVTFFAGPPGGPHAGMVTNLIRSVHMFSKYPVIVFSVNTTNLALDWEPEAFPRMLVYHTNPISFLNDGSGGVSFNFNKFRSMLVRVRCLAKHEASCSMFNRMYSPASACSWSTHGASMQHCNCGAIFSLVCTLRIALQRC
eukprot:m.994419 g.994419  ORF g.994419 m.994419 type:complete len:643 (-) comp24012_c1_seq56:2600-4528(-)